ALPGACCLTSLQGPCCPGTSQHTSHTSQNSTSSTAPQEVVESLFTSSLKEAGGLKHRGQVTTTSLQARDHKHLWMGLWNGRLHCGFTKINRTCKTCQALMSSVEEIGIPIMRETHNRTTPSPDASKLLPSCSRHTSRLVVAWGGTVHFLLRSSPGTRQHCRQGLHTALPETPVEGDEDEETVKIVQWVKSNEPMGATIKQDDHSGAIIITRIMHG
ncbi:uncharacterized protein LOC126991733, partial [Eriocheir sinensis]|uniref:uncharacterized protein LOC126991733 n=1 Tax=Eriocheir sinensis TaxID=95602 RepID=UPI0021C5A7A0